MDLRLLEYFVAVVDHGGVTRAAEALYIAQPSLSQAIRALEREVGEPLFDRTPGGMELTGPGTALLAPARRVLDEAGRGRARVGAVRDLETGRLRIAAVAALTVTPLSELVAALRARHPGIEVVADDPGSPEDVVSAVRQGRAEVGLLPLVVDVGPLEAQPLWTERLVVAMAPELAETVPDPLPVEALRRLPFVLETDDHLGRLVGDPDLLAAIDDVAVRSAHRQAIWELVALGTGATLVTERLAQRILRRVVLRPTVPPIGHRAGIVHRSGQLSPAAAAFVEIARASAEDPAPV